MTVWKDDIDEIFGLRTEWRRKLVNVEDYVVTIQVLECTKKSKEILITTVSNSNITRNNLRH